VNSHPRSQPLLRALGALVAAPAALVAAPFWLVSFLTRRIARLPGMGPASLSYRDLVEYTATLGRRNRAGLDGYGRVDGGRLPSMDLFHVTTDDDGWRGKTKLEDAHVVVFGDGFAFGHGVDDDDMFTHQAEGLTVKSLATDGSSMVHAVLWMERLQDQLTGRTVIWMVFLGNDLYDNLRPNEGRDRMPFVRFRGGRWTIVADHVAPDPWPLADRKPPDYLRELALVCSATFEAERALSAAGYLLRRASDLVRAVDAQLCIITVPHRAQLDPSRFDEVRALSPAPATYDPRRPDAYLAEVCSHLGVEHVPLLDRLRSDHYQDGDFLHWRPGGHRVVGDAIAGAASRALIYRPVRTSATQRKEADIAEASTLRASGVCRGRAQPLRVLFDPEARRVARVRRSAPVTDE
jgi:hypothetical protein